jgi:hypothetical protein
VSYHPTVDTLADRLHRDGWSTGDVAVNYPSGRVWVVSGQRAGRWIVVEGQLQTAAWKQFASAVHKIVSDEPKSLS